MTIVQINDFCDIGIRDFVFTCTIFVSVQQLEHITEDCRRIATVDLFDDEIIHLIRVNTL